LGACWQIWERSLNLRNRGYTTVRAREAKEAVEAASRALRVSIEGFQQPLKLRPSV